MLNKYSGNITIIKIQTKYLDPINWCLIMKN